MQAYGRGSRVGNSRRWAPRDTRRTMDPAAAPRGPPHAEVFCMHTSIHVDSHGNKIVDALASDERQRLVASAEHVMLEVKTVLFEPGQAIRHVFFPLDGVVSLVTPLFDGTIVEVATVGNEGIVGVPLI